MSANYAPDRLDTAKDLRDAGKAVVLRVVTTPAVVDPVARTITTPAVTQDYPVHALEEDRHALRQWAVGAAQGTQVETIDRFLMLAALADDLMTVIPKPSLDDLIIMEGTTFSLKGVQPLQPGDIAIYYEVQLRG
jgi:hypothetical protein